MTVSDVILFSVIFVSSAIAIFFPDPCAGFQPYIVYYMMLLLFLSFLKIDFRVLVETSSLSLAKLGLLVAVKLVILPVALYLITAALLPEFALPVLLISAISTGVVAPFIGALVHADIARVLRMVIVTSVLVPFTLPPLVKILAGAEITVPLAMMMRMLALVIFIPMGAVLILRRVSPTAALKIAERNYPISLALFAMVNFGVFSKYSDFFFQNPRTLLACLGIAYLLAAIYCATGFMISAGGDSSERVAAAVSLGIMNNVLVIAFAAQFFGPLSPTLAAMYMFPFFTMIVPVRILGRKMMEQVGS